MFLATFLPVQIDSELRFLVYSGLLDLQYLSDLHVLAVCSRRSYLRIPFGNYFSDEDSDSIKNWLSTITLGIAWGAWVYSTIGFLASNIDVIFGLIGQIIAKVFTGGPPISSGDEDIQEGFQSMGIGAGLNTISTFLAVR